jgi:beta-glucanase (GH16 family)
MTKFGLLASLVFGITSAVHSASDARAADGGPLPKLDPGWVRPDPLRDLPARSNDQYPLSDQENRSRWTRLAVLSDEFSAGAADSSRWVLEKPSWPGRVPVTFDPANISIRDGALVLKVSRMLDKPEAANLPAGFTHTAAFVRSQAKLLYGYVEIRARIACTTVTSAFFLMDTTAEASTEIDVFEVAGADARWGSRIGMSRHVMKAPGIAGTIESHPRAAAYWTASSRLCDDFHVFGLEWDEESIVWYFDGLPVHRAKNEFHRYPLTVRLDLEAQAYFLANPREDMLPAEFAIDYVRTWQRDRAPAR